MASLATGAGYAKTGPENKGAQKGDLAQLILVGLMGIGVLVVWWLSIWLCGFLGSSPEL
jgi:hypothetical protein